MSTDRENDQRGRLLRMTGASLWIISVAGFTAMSIVQFLSAPALIVWARAAEADGGNGGSTVPIPPPRPPTPGPQAPSSQEMVPNAHSTVVLNLASLRLSPLTDVRTVTEKPVPLVGSQIIFETEAIGALHVVLPFALPSEQALAPFRDSESGIAWVPSSTGAESGILTIPFIKGATLGSLILRLGSFQVDGQRTKAPVIYVNLEFGPTEVKKTSGESGVVRLSASLGRLPSAIVLGVDGLELDSIAEAAIKQAAEKLNSNVVAIAYSVKVETNLREELTSATVRMGVSKVWADARQENKIHIARLDSHGRAYILAASSAEGDTSGLIWFNGESSQGFSTFSLLVLEEAGAQRTALANDGFSASGMVLIGLVFGTIAVVILLVLVRRRISRKT